MSYEPTNITLIEIKWIPTNEIRLSGKRRKTAEFQQKWINQSTREAEWREIPFVHVED